MKNLLKLLSCLFFAALFVISSCVKETFTEEDAYAEQRKNVMLQDSIARSKMELETKLSQEQILLIDSLKKVGGVINYSVAVVNASESSWWSNYMFGFKGKGEAGEQAVSGAVVTLAQHGRRFTATTDASGIASFSDLRIGTANISISSTGFTSVDYVVEMPPLTENFHSSVIVNDGYEVDNTTQRDSTTQNIKDLVRHVATMIPVFSTTNNLSNIRGVATVESDLTNDVPEVAANIRVYGVIDVNNDYFWAHYMYQPDAIDMWSCELCGFRTKFDYYGKVKQIAFGSTVSSAPTNAQGEFNLTVPSTPQGLPIKIEVDEFAFNQTLLLPAMYGEPIFGTREVRTLFGDFSYYESDGYDEVPALGLGALNVQSAYVTFSAPDGVVAAQPTTVAKAEAILAKSGIASVNITDPGEGYTQAPVVIFSLGSGFNSVQAEGTASISGGKVTGVTITNEGSGYGPGDIVNINFVEKIAKKATFEPEFTFSVVEINPVNQGSGYTQTPPTVTIIGSGTGATAHAEMAAKLDKIEMTSMGSGYTKTPIVNISDNFGGQATATAIMTTANPIQSIAYDGTNTFLWPQSPTPGVTITGAGAGATATATLSTSGRVSAVTVTNGGTGYTSAPEVTFTGGGAGFGATGYATFTAGSVTGVVVTDAGQGYTSIPTVTFTGGGGSGAVATVTLGYRIESITLGNAGVNYEEGSTFVYIDNGGTSLNYTSDCDIKYNKGVRSISWGNGRFSAIPTVTITPIDGNGSGASATASIFWHINDIVLDNMGTGYKYDNNNNVYIRIDPPTTPNGVQATANAVLGNGVLSSVRLKDLGEGYTNVPNAYVRVAPSGELPQRQAELTAIVSGGNVTGLTITDSGSGYDYESYINGYYEIEITTVNKDAKAKANVNPKSGQIEFIRITDPGAGYSADPLFAPMVEIYNDNQGDINGYGKGAVATAVVTDGRISAINIINAGSGYYSTPKVRINVSSSLMTALGRCEVSADGRITGVSFTTEGTPESWSSRFNKGQGYKVAPTVTFTPSVAGKGSGAAAIAQIENGAIKSVIMTNQGSGYFGRNKPTRQDFTITDDYLNCMASKSYIVDIQFGTGKRTMPIGLTY